MLPRNALYLRETNPVQPQQLEEVLETRAVPPFTRHGTFPYANDLALALNPVNITPAWRDKKRSGGSPVLKTASDVYGQADQACSLEMAGPQP